MGLNIWLETWFMRNCQRVSRMVDFTTNSPQLVNILTDIFMVNYRNFGHSDGRTLNLHFPDESLYRAFSRCILITEPFQMCPILEVVRSLLLKLGFLCIS